MLSEAFDALKQYDWGTDREPLKPIEDAVAACHGNDDARKKLENDLLSALASDISRDAKDYVCRKLAIIGSTTSIPVLSKLLVVENHSHMARFALERIPGAESAKALLEALSSASNQFKVGIISSIGSRRDEAAVAKLATFISDNDSGVARAAAHALGQIGSAEAAKALQVAKSSSAPVMNSILDAQLTCAEALLANGRTVDAKNIYQSLSNDQQSKLVRLAATRGLLTCAAKNV